MLHQMLRNTSNIGRNGLLKNTAMLNLPSLYPKMAYSDWTAPNLPTTCRWSKDTTEKSPHSKRLNAMDRPKILPNILHHIGNTPMVRLNRVGKDDGLKCDLLIKCEFFNAAGSVKDRIGVRMIEDAEKAGTLKPGMTIIEPTSGNTGIVMALAASIKGYHCIIVMPEKMSAEKADVMRALGAEIVRTPSSARFDSLQSWIRVAQRLQMEIPNSIILDQYRNPGNALAHYDTTAEEIIDQCDGKLDMVVMGTGTGGAITGIGRKLKEKLPNVIVVGVDPLGSVIAEPAELNKTDTTFFEMEGIGHDFVPSVLDRSVVDRWVKCDDKSSFLMARRLIREEGLLCGGSTGANVAAAVRMAKTLVEGQRCVIIAPDSIRNYMTKFLSDSWMLERNFLDHKTECEKHWWWNLSVEELDMQSPFTVERTMTCEDAVQVMSTEGLEQLAILEGNAVIGVVTLGNIVSNISASKVSKSTPIEKLMFKQIKTIYLDTPLGELSRILDTDHFCMVAQKQKNKSKDINRYVGIVNRIDLLKFTIKPNGMNKEEDTVPIRSRS